MLVGVHRLSPDPSPVVNFREAAVNHRAWIESNRMATAAIIGLGGLHAWPAPRGRVEWQAKDRDIQN